MARLIVFRGNAIEGEYEITRSPMRIGRSPQNDVVLLDPVKSVSRDHAEIRVEGGHYLLVDHASENGIWVEGARVPSVELEPDVVVGIGAFRLKLEEEETSGTSPVEPASVVASEPVNPKPVPSQPPDGRRPPGRRSFTVPPRTWLIVGGSVVAIVVVIAAAAVGRRAFTTQSPPPTTVGVVTVTAPPPPPPPPPPVEPTTAERIAAATKLLADGDCAGALETQINLVLDADPDNAEAKQLKAQADRCLNGPRATPQPKPVQLAVRILPENGGLEPFPGEPDTSYQIRINAMRARYDQAVTAATKGASQGAIASFEAIQRDAGPGYLDVGARLAAAKKAWKDTAQVLVNDANLLIVKEMFDEAIRNLKEAKGVDPDLSVDGQIQSIESAKLEAGRQACKLGRQTLNISGLDKARPYYQKALALLPAGDPCEAEARRYAGAGDK